jgi:hypothetical protein
MNKTRCAFYLLLFNEVSGGLKFYAFSKTTC